VPSSTPPRASARSQWWRSASLLAAAGFANAEVGRYERALEYFERIPEADKADAPIHALEQLANCATRVAGKLIEGTPPEVGKAGTLLDRAQEVLGNLAAIGSTSERSSLMGAVMKRRAMLAAVDGRSPGEALREMRTQYDEAVTRAADARAHAYALTNRITADVVLSWTARGNAVQAAREAIDGALDDLQQMSAELAGTRTDFFSLAAEADRLLLRALAHQRLDARRVQDIQARFEEAFSRGVAVRHRDSTRSQFVFLRVLADRVAPRRVRPSIVETLRALEARVAGP
jgi:tetratricopeptide (TPR) repeat protein